MALGTLKVTEEMNFVELRKMDTPSVSMLNVGEKSTEKGVYVFQALVLNIVKFLGAEWTNEQVKECGKNCFDAGYYLTFAELSHFAKKAKSGGFEKVFGKFTTLTFAEWFKIYLAQNNAERELFFSGTKPEFIAPEELVPEEKVHGFVKEFTDEMREKIRFEQAAELVRISDEKNRQVEIMKSKLSPEQLAELDTQVLESVKAIENYNEMLLKQMDLKTKGKTTDQVPDNCINDIPNE